MNLNQLYYFRTIAKLQHFRLAAQELNISQPSLSYSMATLEEELETKLFEKHGRNVYLTKYGKIFLTYVEKSLDTLELGKEKIQKLTSSKAGTIDISYVSPLAPSYIPKLVRHFLDMDDNSGIKFTFKEGLTSEIIQGIKSSKYDLGFCSKVDDETLIFEPIIKQELIIIAHPDHPLSKYTSINLKDIEPYPLIIYTKDSGLGRLTQKMFQDTNINANIICEGDDEHAISGLVAENFGISLVAKTPELDYVNVKQISIDNLKHNRYIYLAYKKNSYQSPAITKFIEYIRDSNLGKLFT